MESAERTQSHFGNFASKIQVRDKPTAKSPQGLVPVSWKISEFKEVRNVPVAISLRGLVAAVVSKFEF